MLSNIRANKEDISIANYSRSRIQPRGPLCIVMCKIIGRGSYQLHKKRIWFVREKSCADMFNFSSPLQPPLVRRSNPPLHNPTCPPAHPIPPPSPRLPRPFTRAPQALAHTFISYLPQLARRQITDKMGARSPASRGN